MTQTDAAKLQMRLMANCLLLVSLIIIIVVSWKVHVLQCTYLVKQRW